jgi:MOSC domain-containing protein YiiM
MKWGPGKLLFIHIAESASENMKEIPIAELIKNRGIKGDRYYNGSGKYSGITDIRDITIIEKEVLDALEKNQPPIQEKSIVLKPHEHRRNLTSEGVPLNYLVGKRFKIGDVILEGGRLNFPCKYLADLLKKPVMLPLYNRSGLNCKIIKSGIIKKNDIIKEI